MVNVVCISDTHGQHRKINELDLVGDLLIVSGDLTYRGEIPVLEDFNAWCGELKERHIVQEIVVIVGNHDLTLDPKKEYEFIPNVKDKFTNFHYLENSGVEVLGLKLWGSPATPFFHNWAFNYIRGDEINKIWVQIPDQVDILITHGPPHGILDVVEHVEWKFTHDGTKKVVTKDYTGCEMLLKAVQRVKPKLHVFGHIHCASGKLEKDGTIFVNASTCTEEYVPLNKPIKVDIEPS